MLDSESIKELRRMRRELNRLARKVDGATGFAVNNQTTMAIGGGGPGAGNSRGLGNPHHLIWVKITGNETGGGKYQGKSYKNTATTVAAATGNVSESELGTLSPTVDCRVLNFAEEGETTHDLTAGTPEIDTFLCDWFQTEATTGLKICAVVAYDRETCS